MTPVQSACEFVDLLTPGNFDAARKRISPDCEYAYAESVLRGQAIIQSFMDNHARAAQKFDRIEYCPATVERINEKSISVLITDRVWIGDLNHAYRDRLVVTLNNDDQLVTRIENRPILGEREKLNRFLKKNVAWRTTDSSPDSLP